jgi:hypothetical protein
MISAERLDLADESGSAQKERKQGIKMIKNDFVDLIIIDFYKQKLKIKKMLTREKNRLGY